MRYLLSLLCVAWTGLGHGAGLAGSPEGTFTATQVTHGRQLYQQHCASCHGEKLQGGSAIALRGEKFMVRWSVEQQTLADIYYVTRTNMPLGLGGSLTNDEYIDLVAHVLAENGYQSGEQALPPDPRILEKIPLGNDHSRQLAATQPPGCPEESFHDPALVPTTAGPTQAELDGADANSNDWLLPDQGYSGRRYSELTQITPGNVSSLQQVCTFDTGENIAAQTAPLVYRGKLFFTTHHSTYAMDAATCKVLWRHERAPRCVEMWGRSRGLGLKDGLVVRGTTDGYLLALNADTGQRVWERRVSETDRAGGSVAMPPLLYGDKVIVGPAPSEVGLKGWISAFDLRSGKLLWKFDAVPEPEAVEAASWGDKDALQRGGGGVWTSFTLDTKEGTVYLPVANPGPAYAAETRPGDNLYSNSVVALDVNTGQLRWHKQMLAADYHDWDLTHAGPLFSINSKNGNREVILVTGKDGMLHLLDRRDQKSLYAVPVSRRENINAELHTDRDTHFCPGLYGGVQWNGAAVDVKQGRLYLPTVEWCASLRKLDEVRYIPGSFFMGGTFKMDPEETAYGLLTAFDAATGKTQWQYQSPRPMLAAVTATASGLLFSGELTGDVLALDAATGKVLQRVALGAPLGGGLITYAANGKQFLAAVAGNPSPLWPAGPGSARIVVLAVPGY